MRNEAVDGLAGPGSNRSAQDSTGYDDLLKDSSLEVTPSMPDAATDADVVAVRAMAEPDAGILAVPATHVGVLRTAIARVAGQLRFTLDEIEDLRIALDESCAILLALAVPDAELCCQFNVTDDALTIEITVAAGVAARLPSESSFAWRVLTALTDNVSGEISEGSASIRLIKHLPRGSNPAPGR